MRAKSYASKTNNSYVRLNKLIAQIKERKRNNIQEERDGESERKRETENDENTEQIVKFLILFLIENNARHDLFSCKKQPTAKIQILAYFDDLTMKIWGELQ